MPNIHRPEVGAIGVRIADTIDNGDFPLIPQTFDGPHTRMEAESIIYRKDILGRDVDLGAEIIVEPVGVWDNGVEAVVTAAQLYDYKRSISYGGRYDIPTLQIRDGRFSHDPIPSQLSC